MRWHREAPGEGLCWISRRLVLLLLTALVMFGCGRASSPVAAPREKGGLQVVVSIGPLGYFAQRVGGDRVQVHVLMGPGTSPHDFEPTPAQMRLLQQADILVLNGVGLEFWADKVVASADNPDLEVVTTSEGLDILQAPDGQGGNPHVWLDPINAIWQVARIREAFVRLDPAGEEIYNTNSARLVEDLKALDRDIMLTLAALSQREVVSLHAAWAYFSRRYQLKEVAVIEERPGEEPTPAELARLVQQAREMGVRVIVVEPQMSAKAAEVIAAEAGMQLVSLDPIGIPPEYDYLRTMRANAQALADALRAAGP